jgi:cyclophilin family peptidyl-prolyl cis-trans isomerase
MISSIILPRKHGGFALAVVLFCIVVGKNGAAFATNTIVRYDTNFGMIDVELFDTAAPQTVDNFLNYAATGRYQDVILHRLAPGFVLQGGAFTSTFGIMPTDPPVVNEPNHTNIRGTVAMAKQAGDPDSATNQWFFNLNNNNASNLDNQNGGFTVFGRVIGDGMSVIDSVTGLPYGSFEFEEFGIDPRVDVKALPVRNYGQTEYNAAIVPDSTHLLIVNDIYVWGSTFSANQNQQDRFDVTNSGTVLPRDLLALIDELARGGERALPDDFVGPLFVDVDGNHRLNQSDVNMLTRHLNETSITQLNGFTSVGLLAMNEFSDSLGRFSAASLPLEGWETVAVPEPTSWVLALIAGSAFGLLRRKLSYAGRIGRSSE